MIKTLVEGLKFGLLLQIAIGPVCLYIFSLGTNSKLIEALKGVIGVVLGDGLYMGLAIFGLASFIKNEKTQKKFNMLGALIVILFGLELILGYFGISIFPKINIIKNTDSSLPFIKAFLLTISNPMTILFWIGVFSTKIEESSSKKITFLFSLGALGATLIFLSFVSVLGRVTTSFIPSNFISLLNIGVGLALIYFGGKKLIRRRNEDSN